MFGNQGEARRYLSGNPAWNRNGSKLAHDIFAAGIGIVNADGSGGQIVPNTGDGFDPDLD